MVGRKKKIHSLQIKSLETKILPTSRCILEICKAAFVHKKGCIAVEFNGERMIARGVDIPVTELA